MSEWEMTTLGALVEVRVSNVDKKSLNGELPVRLCNYMDVYSCDVVHDSMAFMRATATRTEIDRFRLHLGDVVITKDSESPDDIGVPAFIESAGPDLVCGYHLAILRPNEQVDGRFLAYQLTLAAVANHFAKNANGSTRFGLSLSGIKTAELHIPKDKQEQRRIANLLSALDELLYIENAHLKKLTNTRAGVVQQELLSVANAADAVSLGEIAPLVTSGSRGWADYYSEEGALFLRIGNLTRQHPNLRFDDVVRVTVPISGEGARTKLQEGDVLISITADLGIVGCIPADFGEAYINQHIALARVTDSAFDPRWVAHALASTYGSQQIAKLNDGGAKAGLNLPTIRALKVPKASLEQQRRVVTLLDAVDAQIASERADIEKLMKQKQGLLRLLLSPPRHSSDGLGS